MKESNLFTNEEKQSGIYQLSEKPTDPRFVDSYTPLNELNLNWREKELPERERTKHVHRLHPYLGKYIPQLVEIFLRKYFKPGQTVFDPFSGSGTTLVQANELGIHSVGCDISIFNVMLARAKTKKYDIKSVRAEITDILDRVALSTAPRTEQIQLSLIEQILPEEATTQNKFLKQWFAPQALLELLTFRNLISEYSEQDILKVILSRAARSARLTTHFDLDFPQKPQTEPYYCYKHRRICQPTQTAFQFLNRYGLDTIKRIEQFSKIRTDAQVTLIHDDSRNVNPGKIHGIITSPPYVGLINYHEQHQYAYELLGLEDRRDDEIGSASKGSGIKAKIAYQELITDVFKNALQYMPNGGRLIVVAGDKHELYPEIAKKCDVTVEAIIQRHVNRRTGRRASAFYESVFIWQKK